MIREATKDRPAETAPPQAEWSPEVDMLARVVDGVTALTHVQIAAGGGKPPRFTPVVRPATPSKAVDHKKRMAEHEALVARVKAAPPASETTPIPADETSELFRQ